MSLLILTVEGEPFVHAVLLDDPSPGIAAMYADKIRANLTPDEAQRFRWSEVDVDTVAEYGPSDLALFLTERGREIVGVTDLPQRWERD